VTDSTSGAALGHPSPPLPRFNPNRSIALLALAAFACQSMVRVTDSMLPQIAADFSTTVGDAAIVVTGYAIAHGSVQLVIGPVGDRLGKYLAITIACALTGLMVLLCALAPTLGTLAAARLASGAAAGWIIPISLAYIGDVVPYEGRQPIIGRYLSGQIMGQLFGQAAGGILGDLLGWRNVFVALAGIFVLATLALVVEMIRSPATRAAGRPEETSRGLFKDYVTVLSNPWARMILIFAVIEFAFTWGIFAYVGADLHLRFGLSYTLVGLIVGAFGLGGLIYAMSVRALVNWLGQIGLAIAGGVMLGVAFLILALGLAWWIAPVAVVGIGLGFYMIHNTLQTNATQMVPHVRGTAVGMFSASLYLGQTVGVGIGSLVIDRFGAVPLFAASAIVLPLLGLWFARLLKQRRAEAVS
jgi:predicted MFS family arabinose efflux permease